MKRITFLLACVLAFVLAAGCAPKNEAAPSGGDVLTVYSAKNQAIRIGDTQQQVEKITGTAQELTVEFEEDNVTRSTYWDAEGLAVDYSADGVVVALRITGGEWKLANGLAIGKQKQEAADIYDSSLYKLNEAYNGVYVAFNEKFEQVAYAEDAPYLLQIDSDSANQINMITLQSNL